jgi:hypothetical protein
MEVDARMSLSINGVNTNYKNTTVNKVKNEKAPSDKVAKNDNDSQGVVYEKSEAATTPKTKADYSAIVKQLKAEQENRQKQLMDLVFSTLKGQGKSFSLANGLAEIFENLEVDEKTIEQAKEDISEDGYWGINQTSDRLVSMAQALCGGDKSKADEMINAIKKGYEQATKAWGKELPGICSQTLDATIDKMEAWRDGTE